MSDPTPAPVHDPAPRPSEPAALASVFEPTFLRKLDRLQLRVRHSLATRPGNTPMPHGSQPSGIELANYKSYHPGDDLRYLDWNAYGRLDELLIKTFRAEREAALHVLIDCSASMGVPAADGKFSFAQALAASLSYVSLRNNDPVRIVALSALRNDTVRTSPWFRHRDALGRLRAFLVSLRARDVTTLAESVRAYARQARVPGVAVVVSDFLTEPRHYESALRTLIGYGWTLGVVRLLGPGERDPSRVFRRARVRDSETGAERIISLTPANRARYESALTAHLDGLRTWCAQHEVYFALVDPHSGLEHALFHDLVAAGMVR
ncbi:MAG TPA: DUF58 domain-containing protein [Candidatus Binatia bacterium]|nr:DUF58 domain-containing protein [Candidatus Binatia bacterium]